MDKNRRAHTVYPSLLPRLDAGSLPRSYIKLGATRWDGPSSIRDPAVEVAEKATASISVPAPPLPPAELTKDGKPLTKKQKKEVCLYGSRSFRAIEALANQQLHHKTAGPDWFDLLAPSEADLPRMYREVEALRLRNHLDPKRFYRRDEGEGKGIKGLPKYFAVSDQCP